MDEKIKKYFPLWDDWQLDEYVGKGSYGTVFKIHNSKNEIAALKYISIPKDKQEVEEAYRDGNATDEESLKKYFSIKADEVSNETMLMMKLKNFNNIVHYEDHIKLERKDEFGWDIFIRMEFLSSLDKYLKVHSFTKKDVVLLGIDICSAIKNCHDNQIMHRDVKIENIFIDKDGRFKLGDFGVSRESQGNSTSGTAIGTQSYMAPEMVKHERYNNNIDLYALGIVLYRLLNNRRAPYLPANGVIKSVDNAIALEKRVNGKESMPKPEFADEKLAEIILKACAHNRKKRYSNPDDMRRDLISIKEQVSDEIVLQPRDHSNDKTERMDDSDMGMMTELMDDFEGSISGFRDKKTQDGKGVLYDDVYELPKRSVNKKIIILSVLCIIVVIISGVAIFKLLPIDSIKSIYGLDKNDNLAVDEQSLTPTILPENDANNVYINATSIDGIPDNLNLIAESNTKLTPVVMPENATNKTVTYSSSNEAVAVIGIDGVITALSPGQTTITASVDNVVKEMVLTVTEKPAEQQSTSKSNSKKTETSKTNSSTKSTQSSSSTNKNTQSSSSSSKSGTSSSSNSQKESTTRKNTTPAENDDSGSSSSSNTKKRLNPEMGYN